MDKKNRELMEELLAAVYAKDKLREIEAFIREAGDMLRKDDLLAILDRQDGLED